jgi:hypothetical protein
LNLSSNDKKKDELMRTNAAIVFLGTPHRGAASASLANIGSKLVNTLKLGSGASTAPAELKLFASTIIDIHTDFVKLPIKLSIVSFFETKGYSALGTVSYFQAIMFFLLA